MVISISDFDAAFIKNKFQIEHIKYLPLYLPTNSISWNINYNKYIDVYKRQGKTAELLAESFERDKGIGYEIIGFIEDDRKRPLLKKYPYLGSFQEAEQAVLCANVQDVILATPGLKRKELVKLFYRIQPHVRNLTIVPDVFGVPVGNVEVEGFYDQKTILLKMQNNMKKRRNRWLKRSFDFTASLVGSLAIAPLLLCISAVSYTHLFDEQRQFNIASFEQKVNELLGKQDSLLVILNTPAHNPTGYSLSVSDWEKVLGVCKAQAKNPAKKITLLVDIAYIDYAGEKNETRKFFKLFGNLPANILGIVAFSMSKGYTIDVYKRQHLAFRIHSRHSAGGFHCAGSGRAVRARRSP